MKTLRHREGSIDWYCELRGSGPTVVLIPSGEGDCANFAAVAEQLAAQFTVLTFDTPGFSRSTARREEISALKLSDQIAALVTSLDLQPAAFYGCSSGGIAVLDLVADHPEIVRNALVHEAALVKEYAWPDRGLIALGQLDDAGIVAACTDMFRNHMNADPRAWDALGPEYHGRLEKNYVTWIRCYPADIDKMRTYTSEDLSRRPIAWSIGGFSPAWFAISNWRVAQRGNIDVEVFRCRHFPQVEIPDVLAKHIAKHSKRQLGEQRAAPEAL